MTFYIAVLEAEDDSWSDEPLPTDGSLEEAVSNARAMWPTIPDGHRIAIYRCEFKTAIDPEDLRADMQKPALTPG